MFVPLIGNATVIEDDITSWWTCDEESGTRVDSVGSNDLTDNNTVLYTSSGMANNACSFTRANTEYLSIADASQTGLEMNTAYTITMWHYSTTDYQIALFGKTDGTIPNQTIYFDITTHPNHQYREYTSNGSTQDSDYTSSLDWKNNDEWYFLAWAYDGSGNFKIYHASSTGEVYLYDTLVTSKTPVDGSAPFTIGASGSAGNPMQGYIDEIGFFNRELTLEEIGDVFESVDMDTLLNGETGTTSTTTTTSTPVDFDELIDTVSLYLSIFVFVLFSFVGYKFMKLFI